MLEVRYGGCGQCLSSVKKVLSSIGRYEGKDFRVEFHADHKRDKIYEKRPDYINEFSGAILYNPDTQHWVDFYSSDHSKMVMTAKDDEAINRLKAAYEALQRGL